MKRCLVAYALPERQFLWTVEVADDATVRDALAAARRLAESGESGESGGLAGSGGQAGAPGIPWDEASVGIFGETCDRGAIPRDGDRIEIYRPLGNDPKQARRERVASARRARR